LKRHLMEETTPESKICSERKGTVDWERRGEPRLDARRAWGGAPSMIIRRAAD